MSFYYINIFLILIRIVSFVIILVHFLPNLSLYTFYSYKTHFTLNIQTYITIESYITPNTHKSSIPLITHNAFNTFPKHTNFSKNLDFVHVLYHQTICHCVITVKHKHHKLPLVTSIISIQSFVSYYLQYHFHSYLHFSINTIRRHKSINE